MDECTQMGLKVLGPDVNESRDKFFVNKSGDLRFGMAAIKGVGAGAVDDIVIERDKKGEFKSVFDFVERVNLQSVNKKNMEALAMAGAFDGFGAFHRAQYFADNGEGVTFIEALMRYGNRIQAEKATSMATLFGGGMGVEIKLPAIPKVEEWPRIVMLDKEKSLIGIYLSAHPLDDYKIEINSLCTKDVVLADLNENIRRYTNRDLTFAGIVTEASEGTSKNGKPYAVMVLTDFNGSYKMMFFGNDFISYAKYCRKGLFLMVKGRVMEKWRGSDELEFKPSKIELLQEVAEHAEHASIEIHTDLLSGELIEELDKAMAKTQGRTNVKFVIFDPITNIRLKLFSRNRRILITSELKTYLQNHSNIASISIN